MSRYVGRILSLVAVLCALCSCKGGQGQPSGPSQRDFRPSKAPAMMTEQSDIVLYLSEHFWDSLWDVSDKWLRDSSHVSGVSYASLRDQMSSFMEICGNLPLESAKRSMRKICKDAVAHKKNDPSLTDFEVFNEFIELCLFDPNSPYRNEDLYEPYAALLSECEYVGPAGREKYSRQAAQCRLNPVGSVAADFSFSDKVGKIRTLHSIKAEHTILFFSNPGCEACKNIIEYLRSERKVNSMIASGALAVVNVYIDEDIESWYNYMPYYPEEWYNGYDHNQIIRTDELYDVRAIPSLYLLDRDKRVLLKDCPEPVMYDAIQKL